MPMRRGLRTLTAPAGAAALFLLAGVALPGCQPSQPCDNVSGSCLVLRVEGSGSYDSLQGALVGATADLRQGMLVDTPRAFPLVVRMVPPAGVSTSSVTAVRLEALRGGQIAATGTTAKGFAWPDGTHIEAALQLSASDPQPPGPLLVWRTEPTPAGATSPLIDVWALDKGSTDFVLAVGDNGTVVTKDAGVYTTELSTTNTQLAGVFGQAAAGSSIFAVSQGPNAGVYRRDPSPVTWSRDTGSPTPPGKGFWCVAAGAAAGEVWAGDNDGKVWHRTVSGTPSWTSENVFPSIAIYGIAQAGGAIFAVGDTGYVAYRRDSAVATPWVTGKVTSNFTSGDWLQGLWAFDKDNAVAVGTSGTFVRFQGGSWATSATKIDSNNTELFGIWGTGPGKVWAVGRNGLILRVDGTTTYKLHSQPGVDLYAIFGLSETNVYAVGGSAGQPSLILRGSP